MLKLDPGNPEELASVLKRAVKQSELGLAHICQRLKEDYGVDLSVSGLSHLINPGTIRPQRALQILAICGVEEVHIRGRDRGE